MSKKTEREKAAIDAIVGLDKKHKELINCPTADPVDLVALAVLYMHAGMPSRGGKILREARDRDNRIYVPSNDIIDPTSPPTAGTSSGYGGTNETTLPVRIDNLSPASVGLRADC